MKIIAASLAISMAAIAMPAAAAAPPNGSDSTVNSLNSTLVVAGRNSSTMPNMSSIDRGAASLLSAMEFDRNAQGRDNIYRHDRDVGALN